MGELIDFVGERARRRSKGCGACVGGWFRHPSGVPVKCPTCWPEENDDE